MMRYRVVIRPVVGLVEITILNTTDLETTLEFTLKY